MHFYFSVNKVLIGDITLTSPTGDRTAILCCLPSHAVDRILSSFVSPCFKLSFFELSLKISSFSVLSPFQYCCHLYLFTS